MNRKERILDVIKEAIDFYDPEDLLNIGAPDNEYLHEAKIISNRLLESEINQLSKIIQETFEYYFGKNIDNSLLLQIVNRITTNLNQV